MPHTSLGAKMICGPRENMGGGPWLLSTKITQHLAAPPHYAHSASPCCIPSAGPAALTVPELPSSPLNFGTGTPFFSAPPGKRGVLSAAMTAGCLEVQDGCESNFSRLCVLCSGVGNAA